MTPMIYLNNAATTYPKPQCVLEAHAAALMSPPSSQFRGAGSFQKETVFDGCRKRLGELLNIKDTNRIFFTSGATEAFNTLLSGLNLQGKKIVTTVTEHNSVLRPLYNLPASKGNKNVILVPCDCNGSLAPEAVEKAIIPETGAIIINHCSNVTGAIQDLKAIGEIAKKHQILFLVDASQSAGCVPIKTDQWGIDSLVFAGHKSLYGVQGTGGFYIREGIPLRPLMFGGTGRDSSKLTYRQEEYEYEVGTRNEAGIAALGAGVSYILEKGQQVIADKEEALWNFLYDSIAFLPHVTVYGKKGVKHGPVLSFNIEGLKPSDTAYILSSGYEIVVRSGLHCAPLIHEYLGTKPYGTVRIGFSDLTTEQDIVQLVKVIQMLNDSAGELI